MNTRTRICTAVVVGLLSLAGGCRSLVTPAPERIVPWTTQLRELQPEDAFADWYSRRGHSLLFIAAKHANRTDSLTFRLIEQAYETFEVDTLIVEGFPYSYGPNPAQVLTWVDAQRESAGVTAGEIVPAIRGARMRHANVWGGEPQDAEIRDRVLAKNFQLEDLLGFYTLRTVPQWLREKKIDAVTDSRIKALLEKELEKNRARLAAPREVLPDHAAWEQWYRRTNRKDFGAGFELEEAGGLADGRYESNRIGAAIGTVRDEFLLSVIAQHLNAGERVMVVFGSSHLTLLRPALRHMLGPPIYQGSELEAAARVQSSK